MEDFKNKVAVVTGAASGIGNALAEKCLSEGMHVVLADIEEEALKKATSKFQSQGFNSLLPVVTNVSIRTEIEALAAKAVDEFGGVHLLFNNAGVGAGGSTRDATYDDWEWVIGVNLWSVIYGLKTFIPIMEAQEGDCHIVNTASVAGLVYGGGSAPYAVTKHAVVAITEATYGSHMERGSNVGASVLCPGFTSTNIMESGRNRPEELSDISEIALTPEAEVFKEEFRQRVINGLPPADLATMVFQGIRNKSLYILTADEFNDTILERAKYITEGFVR
jgi:NAD(P)-dependent dehydrogenase (short-subunit alcohol dehydrogenase family)